MCELFAGGAFIVFYKGHVDTVGMVSMGSLIALLIILYLYLWSSILKLKSFP